MKEGDFKTNIAFGLKDIVVLKSSISRIDGESGKLEYQGYNIKDLVNYSTFEEVAFLLWHGYLPSKKELNNFSQDLAERRKIPLKIVEFLYTLPKITHPTVILRTAISYLACLDPKLKIIEEKEIFEKSKNLLAKIPTMVAFWQRIREGKSLIYPVPELNHTENFFYMFFGRKPRKIEAKALDKTLIVHAEHGLAASTFAARITASTLSDIYAAIVAAIGVLFGPLHGGASQAVMKSLMEIKMLKKREIQKWVDKKFEKKEKIMGFGHRVYKTFDPRIKILREIGKKLDKLKNNNWVFICDQLTKAVQKRKNLFPNIDLYSAPVYANLGIPDDMFINIFAIGRIVGWTAHIMEQYKNNKLIRPLHEYIGKTNKKYPKKRKR